MVGSLGHGKRAERDSQPLEIEETALIAEGDDTAYEPPVRSRLPGDTFGRYRIVKTLGEGAMGSVYLAHDTQLDRKVALKIPKFSADADSKYIERFLREARSAATLSHPNICPVYDVGEIEGTHFITMAYVQGRSLSEFINPDKPQRDRNVASVIRKIALALHEAHINGLVHRDVKPANVMIDQRNEPIIMDFGLARHVDETDDARLTKDGAILGSPAYMSPEQVEGKTDLIGPACDIYSLGVILYELLTGKLPFQGSVASIIGQILAKEPDDPTRVRPDISARLAAICLKAMAKKIDGRYPSMKELASALAEFLRSKPAETTAGEEQPEKSESSSVAKAEGKKAADVDADSELKLTRATIEVTCRCGQQLVAGKALAGKLVKCPRCGGAVALPGGDPAKGSSRQISVTCQCGQRFMAQATLAGRVVRCPMCSRPLTVPAPGTAQPATRQIDVTCLCGQQFLARPDLAGKRVKCTACGRPLEIPRLR